MESPSTVAEQPRDVGSRIALIAWLAVAGIQVAIAFALGRSGVESDSEPFYEIDLAVAAIVFYSILIGVTFWIASAYPSARAALGLRSFERRWIWIALGVVVGSVVVAAALEPVLHAGEEQGLAPEEWRPDRAGVFLVNAIIVATLVPFAEELFFRGLGVRVLAVFGSVIAVLGTAVIFGLAHGIWVALPPLVLFALGLAYVRLSSDSVWPCVIAHGLYNAAGVAIAYLTITQ